MDQLDLEVNGHGVPLHNVENDWLDGDEDSDSYQSTNPPRYIEARAKLVFPDCDYPITKPVNIIGRGPGLPRVLASRNLEGSDPEDSGDYVVTGSKRRRRNSTEYHFRGGLGGPQSPAASSEDDSVVERINIWPPQDEDGSVPNTISRDHAKVVWDTHRREWVLEVLGRNGLYLQGLFYRKGDTVYLEHGDNILISRVDMHFFTAEGEDTDESEETGGSISEDSEEDSPDDEDVVNEPGHVRTRSLLDRRRRAIATIEADEEGSNEEEDERELDEDDGPELNRRSIKLSIKAKSGKPSDKRRRRSTTTIKDDVLEYQASGRRKGARKATRSLGDSKARKRAREASLEKQSSDEQDESRSAAGEQEQRKRGPGRPPADGVMSKKERRDRERAKRLGLEYGKDELPVRPHNKSRKDRDNADEDIEDTKRNKKSKRKGLEAMDMEEELDDEDSSPSAERSAPRRDPTPRPATPEPARGDFSQEQLQKPDLTYHVMLVEILSKSDRAMSLPEIYKAFKKRWPYFYFLGSHGWESSIRHNLQSSTCILKDGKQGKGHNWRFHAELMKEEPKTNRQKVQQTRAPAYPALPQSVTHQNNNANGFQPQMHPAYQHTNYQQHSVTGQPVQAHPQPTAGHGRTPHSYVQHTTSQAAPQYNRPAGQTQPPSNLSQQPSYPAIGSQGGVPPNSINGTQSATQVPGTSQPQPIRHPYPTQSQMCGTNGSSQYPPTAQPRLSTPSTLGSVGPRYTVPVGPHNGLSGTKSARDAKRQVFEHFRASLVKNVRDEETKLRYNRLVNQAIDWLMRNPDATTFSSADSDLNKVVPQMMSLWNQHGLNPASPNFSGFGSPAMRQSPSTSGPAVQSPLNRGASLPSGAGTPRPPSAPQTGQTQHPTTSSASASGTPQPISTEPPTGVSNPSPTLATANAASLQPPSGAPTVTNA